MSIALVETQSVSTGNVGAKIAKALLAAQKKIETATKDGTNPHFGNDFLTLNGVIAAVKKPLNDEGIVFLQVPAPTTGETLGITTILLHESGEYISGTAVVPLQKTDPQGYGSAMTYARRYSLQAAVGLQAEDDDAEAAVGRVKFKPEVSTAGSTPAPSAKPSFRLGNFGKPSPAKAPARGKTGMFPSTEDSND